jgi:hypothetical protein
MKDDLEASSFQKRPCYRYIRQSDRIPSIQEAQQQGDSAQIKVKLFDPTGSWTWYIAGYDPSSRLAWGLVDGHEAETGDFSMEEIVSFRGRTGLPIERDLWWVPLTIADVSRAIQKRWHQSGTLT